MNRRTLLLLSYIYPPSRFFEIAGQRPYQFAKHLPQNGWRVIVVTRYWDDSSVHGEHKLPGDMPPVTEWNLASAVEAGIRDLDNSSRAVIKVPFQATGIQRAFGALDSRTKANPLLVPLRKLTACARELSFNRTGTTWLQQAHRVAESLCEKQAVSCIMATAPPADTLVLGERLATQFNLPWIADLRDRAMEMLPRKSHHIRRLSPAIRSAAAVLSVSDELCESEMKDLTLKSRPHLIPNGFDPSEYVQAPASDSSRFEVCYTGSLYNPRRVPDVFLDGLRLLFQQAPSLRESIRFRYMGRSAELMLQLASKYGVEDILCNDGHVTREQAIRAQMQASVLLHLTDSTGVTGIATGKIYEYFAAARPILAVPGDNSTADRLITSSNTGVIARTPADVAAIVSELHTTWQCDGKVTYLPKQDIVSSYNRAEQSRQLSAVLDGVCAAS